MTKRHTCVVRLRCWPGGAAPDSGEIMGGSLTGPTGGPGGSAGQLHVEQLDLTLTLRSRVGHLVARLMSGEGLPQRAVRGQRLGLAADRSLFDDGDHVHRDDLTVGETQGYLGTAGERLRIVGGR